MIFSNQPISNRDGFNLRYLILGLAIVTAFIAITLTDIIDLQSVICKTSCLNIVRVPSNSGIDLVRSNNQSFGINLVFSELYKGKTIITIPNYWETHFHVYPNTFIAWGDLGKIRFVEYNPNITSYQLDQIGKSKQITMSLYNNIDRMVDFIFVKSTISTSEIIVLISDNKVIFVPLEIAEQISPTIEYTK